MLENANFVVQKNGEKCKNASPLILELQGVAKLFRLSIFGKGISCFPSLQLDSCY